MKNFGEKFIHQKDTKLHTSAPIEHELERRKKLKEKNKEKTKDLNISSKPANKISNWLEVLEKTHAAHQDDPRVLERIKNYYHKEYVIKPQDIPESVFILEQTIARNQGHGRIRITDEFKDQKTKEIISNQQRSLDKWLDYFSSPDASYPIWAKYWAFKSMLSMGKLEKIEDKKTGKETVHFKKRTKNTAASFPVLNPRALAMTISTISAKVEKNNKEKKERISPDNLSAKLSKQEFEALVNTENFSKIYAQFLVEMPEYSSEGLQETRGEWESYKKGSAPDKLVASLDGHPLEWCTANIDTARTQLQCGDFHVYYSIDEQGEATIPRVAIRMAQDNIAEVRGIGAGQHLDPYIHDVVKEKMNEFPDGEYYQKQAEDMKRLTEIEERHKLKQMLSKDDLRFLYEFDSEIEGFGTYKDPRIQEIINNRNKKQDIACIMDLKEEEVSLTYNEVLSGGIIYHHGDLKYLGLHKILTENDTPNINQLRLQLPNHVSGTLDLGPLTSLDKIILPKSVGGSIIAHKLREKDVKILREKYPRKRIASKFIV